MEIRCSTDFGIRKCGKYLGTFDLLIGNLYCKSCKQANYYEVTTVKGLHIAKNL